VPTGKVVSLYADGTNVHPSLDYLPGLVVGNGIQGGTF